MHILFWLYRFTLPFAVFAVSLALMPLPCVAQNALSAVEIPQPTPITPAISPITQHLFMQLQGALTPPQQDAALIILAEAGPRIAEAQSRVAAILGKLRELSFSAHTQSDKLAELGQELLISRDALRAELRRVSENLEKGIGLNPQWDVPRTCAMPQTVQGRAMHKK